MNPSTDTLSIDLAHESDFAVGQLRVKPSSREILTGDDLQTVEPRVMQVLVALARRRGQVLSRDQLISECWEGRVVGEDAIQRCIAKLRRVANEDNGLLIETIPRIGYRLAETAGESAAHPPTVTPSSTSISRERMWPRVAMVAIAFIVLVGSITFSVMQWRTARWAQREKDALVDIATLLKQDRYGAAYMRAHPLVTEGRPPSEEFRAIWKQIVLPTQPLVDQTGATVYFKPAGEESHEWIEMGVTPLKKSFEAPRGVLKIKVEKAGFRTGYFVIANPGPSVAFDRESSNAITSGRGVPQTPLPLVADDTLRNDLLPVPHTNAPDFLAGLSRETLGAPRDVPAFTIARDEVSNREFKEFIEAGGYDNPEYWKDFKFTRDGHELSWAEARKLFVDTTGRPGPADWQLSSYPLGKDAFPVGGVSWYEAVAYARFRGRMLPTIFHWTRAAFAPYEPTFPTAATIALRSHFLAEGPVASSENAALGPWGTRNMMGNVREWVWNFCDDQAVSLGGAWKQYPYMGHVLSFADPMTRSSEFGFRLMQSAPGTQLDASFFAPIQSTFGDASVEIKPVSDEVFAAIRSQFTAPHVAPSNVSVKTLELAPQWSVEEVVLDYAADEPTTLYIVKPRTHTHRLQPIIYTGPGDCCLVKRPNRDQLEHLGYMGFVADSGRALIMPIWAGGYERYEPFVDEPTRIDRSRKRPLQWQHDLSSTIDYLESRSDMDAKRIGYFANSRTETSVVLAIEPRVQTAILTAAGVRKSRTKHPMADLLNYAPRITIPVLLINGRYDHVVDENAQRRLFTLLGTPANQKTHVFYNVGHMDLPQHQLATDVTDWFDKYLGPVAPK